MKRLNPTIYIDLAFCLILLPVLMMMLPLDRWMEQRPTFVVLLIIWLYILYALLRLVIVPQIFAKRYFITVTLFLATIVITHRLTLVELDFQYRNQPRKRTETRAHGSKPTPSSSSTDSLSTTNNATKNSPARPRTDVSPEMRMTARRNFISQQQQSGWFLYVLVVAFGYAVALLSQLNKQISLNKDMALEKKRAELALYKAQINPHFLFNTLNTIYGLILTKSEEAEEAFMLFINLMKYIYTNGTADQIAVDDEVEYIKQYIALQSLRINESTEVLFDYRNDDKVSSSLRIAPMLLITFVENAFKYGVSSHTSSRIVIDIEIKDRQLKLAIQNPIINDNQRAERSEGIGIKNCRQRLQLLYPKRHDLTISDDGAEYNLMLSIDLV